jgi:methionine-gamma-lyase
MTDSHNRFLGNRALSPETLMMGYGYDPFLSERSLKPPIFQTSTFVFRSARDGKEFFELAYGLRQKRPNEEPGLIYSRINNPDLEMLEDRLAIWDQAEASLVFASGMAAIWAHARPGTVIIHSGPVYGGTDFLLKTILPQFGVTSIGFHSEGGNRAMEEAVESARGKGPIAALYIETPANPTNGMVDLERARKIVSALPGPDGNRPVIIVDNTMLGPIYQTPLAHGADLVVTSLTKYVGGHSAYRCARGSRPRLCACLTDAAASGDRGGSRHGSRVSHSRRSSRRRFRPCGPRRRHLRPAFRKPSLRAFCARARKPSCSACRDRATAPACSCP